MAGIPPPHPILNEFDVTDYNDYALSSKHTVDNSVNIIIIVNLNYSLYSQENDSQQILYLCYTHALLKAVDTIGNYSKYQLA